MKKDKELIKFQINQLRLDKIIYAVDAAAFDLGALLFISFAYDFLPLPQNIIIISSIAAFAFAVLFTIYAGVSNLVRFRKIKELEKKL